MINLSKEQITDMMTFVHLKGEQDLTAVVKVKDLMQHYEERPTGEWIIDGHHIRCNRCNEYICNTDREGNKIPDNFCPNCGTYMRKGERDYE